MGLDKNQTPQVFVGQVWKYNDERYPEPFLVHAIHRAGERMPGTDHRFLADSVYVEHGTEFGKRSKWPNLWADRPYASFGKAFILVAETEGDYYAMRDRALLTPTPGAELPEGVSVIDLQRKFGLNYATASNILDYVTSRLASLPTAPREWDRETIKDAPEGRYMIRRSSDGHWSWELYSMTRAYDWLVLGGYHGGVIVDAAFGPLPEPPTRPQATATEGEA